jgi:hypothetical protein
VEDAYVAKEGSPRKNRRGTRKASTAEAMSRRASRLEEINQRIEMSKQNIQQQQQQQQVLRPSSPLHSQQQLLQQQHQQQQNQQHHQEDDHFKMPIRKQSLAVNFHASPNLLSSMGLTSSKGASSAVAATTAGGNGRLYIYTYIYKFFIIYIYIYDKTFFEIQQINELLDTYINITI